MPRLPRCASARSNELRDPGVDQRSRSARHPGDPHGSRRRSMTVTCCDALAIFDTTVKGARFSRPSRSSTKSTGARTSRSSQEQGGAPEGAQDRHRDPVGSTRETRNGVPMTEAPVPRRRSSCARSRGSSRRSTSPGDRDRQDRGGWWAQLAPDDGDESRKARRAVRKRKASTSKRPLGRRVRAIEREATADRERARSSHRPPSGPSPRLRREGSWRRTIRSAWPARPRPRSAAKPRSGCAPRRTASCRAGGRARTARAEGRCRARRCDRREPEGDGPTWSSSPSRSQDTRAIDRLLAQAAKGFEQRPAAPPDAMAIGRPRAGAARGKPPARRASSRGRGLAALVERCPRPRR